MGGPVALAAAKRMPGTVVGRWRRYAAKCRVQDARRCDQEVHGRFRQRFQGNAALGLDGLLPEKVDPELKKWLVSRAEAQDQTMAIALMRHMSAPRSSSFAQRRPRSQCAASTPAGGYSFLTPTDIAVNKKHADYDAVTIEAVGHYPMLEKPEEFNRKLRSVLKQLAEKAMGTTFLVRPNRRSRGRAQR